MHIGAGLLYYGQNYLIYPSAFPPGSRIGVYTLLGYHLTCWDSHRQTSPRQRILAFLLKNWFFIHLTGLTFGVIFSHKPKICIIQKLLAWNPKANRQTMRLGFLLRRCATSLWPFVLFAVFIQSTNRYHVSRKWRKSRPSYSSRQDFLLEDAL